MPRNNVSIILVRCRCNKPSINFCDSAFSNKHIARARDNSRTCQQIYGALTTALVIGDSHLIFPRRSVVVTGRVKCPLQFNLITRAPPSLRTFGTSGTYPRLSPENISQPNNVGCSRIEQMRSNNAFSAKFTAHFRS